MAVVVVAFGGIMGDRLIASPYVRLTAYFHAPAAARSCGRRPYLLATFAGGTGGVRTHVAVCGDRERRDAAHRIEDVAWPWRLCRSFSRGK